MIIQPSFPSGYVIFCDDVRQEVGGKITIVGAYAGEMTAYGETPIALAQLYASVVFRNAPKDDLYALKIVVAMVNAANESKVISTSEFEIPAPEKDMILPLLDEHSVPMMELRNIVRMSPLVLTEPGIITVRAYVGDDEIRLGSLDVKIASLNEYQPYPTTDPS